LTFVTNSDSVRLDIAMARILIADDSTLVRRVLRNLVEQHKDWEVCGEAIDGGEVVQKTMETRPDLIVLDFQMPVMNGLQAAKEIAKVAPEVPVLLCTAHLSIDLVGEARRIGIQGAVSKSRAGDIVKGIRALLRHELFFCQPA
jgi:DNA-binding NarL/FixJ family response regulator